MFGQGLSATLRPMHSSLHIHLAAQLHKKRKA
jgi:hypothetical protein